MATLDYLSGCAFDVDDGNQLKQLATNEDQFHNWQESNPSVIDVFKQFPSLLVESSQLVHRMGVLKPR